MNDDTPRAGTYARHFGSLDSAFQRLFTNERDRARQTVHEQIRKHVPEVMTYADFRDKKLTLSIQPAVPVPHGYKHPSPQINS